MNPALSNETVWVAIHSNYLNALLGYTYDWVGLGIYVMCHPITTNHMNECHFARTRTIFYSRVDVCAVKFIFFRNPAGRGIW